MVKFISTPSRAGLGNKKRAFLSKIKSSFSICSKFVVFSKIGTKNTPAAIRTRDPLLRSCITQYSRCFSEFIRIYLCLLRCMNLKLILFSYFIRFNFELSEFLQLICNFNAIKERLKIKELRFRTRLGEGQNPLLASFNRSHRKILYFLTNKSQQFANFVV